MDNTPTDPSSPPSRKGRILIAGLGFTGGPLAQALTREGWEILGLTHSETSARNLRDLSGIDVRAADISSLSSLKRALEPREDGETGFDWAIHCASSGRGGPAEYRAVYLEGLRNLRALCPDARLLFTSSTSVYAQTDGAWVDESSPAEPLRETGRILLESEAIALATGGIVARLAGIYGPGRSYLLLKFLEDTAVIEGDGGRFINQVHRDDIVRALAHLLASEARGLFNVADSSPQTQLEIYGWLAEQFGKPLPPQAPPDYQRKRGWTHKRVSNRKLRETGWEPLYPSLQQAILADPSLLASVRGQVR